MSSVTCFWFLANDQQEIVFQSPSLKLLGLFGHMRELFDITLINIPPDLEVLMMLFGQHPVVCHFVDLLNVKLCPSRLDFFQSSRPLHFEMHQYQPQTMGRTLRVLNHQTMTLLAAYPTFLFRNQFKYDISLYLDLPRYFERLVMGEQLQEVQLAMHQLNVSGCDVSSCKFQLKWGAAQVWHLALKFHDHIPRSNPEKPQRWSWKTQRVAKPHPLSVQVMPEKIPQTFMERLLPVPGPFPLKHSLSSPELYSSRNNVPVKFEINNVLPPLRNPSLEIEESGLRSASDSESIHSTEVRKCEECGTTESPEWRKGASGTKSLCNACGLRYSRIVAKQRNAQAKVFQSGKMPEAQVREF
ncbi:hypothetical protein EDD86DRAFT_262271 [Gorgonomyces haynaldii]|nr:hypothetical protein EDD86DRAFT_262271 [Gorgonomyces haynaldii]